MKLDHSIITNHKAKGVTKNSWEGGSGGSADGVMPFFDPRLDGVTTFFEPWRHGVTTFFDPQRHGVTTF